MKKLFVCLAALSMIGMAGCVTRGNVNIKEESEASVAEKIKVGKTTQDDVRALYGAPGTVMTGTEKGAETIWSYSFVERTADAKTFIPVVGVFAGKNQTKANWLMVYFDKRGVVSNYQFGTSNTGN